MSAAAAATAGFLHLVYFYAAENSTSEDASALIAGIRRHLTGIPGVVRLETGVPAGTPRAAVDNSYLVALLVEYEDAAGHDVYQDHPDHLRFIAECSPLWSRVQVFDTLIARG
ncbi:MAG: Dabb family protein [Cytophagales bacterium]|nr:Dabb family protein [Armatimonadota bacterium]